MNNTKFINCLIRPEVLLIIMAALFATIGLIFNRSGLHIGLYYSVYIIEWPLWVFPVPLILLLFALIYWLTRNFRQWKALQYFHVLCFLLVPFIIGMYDFDYTVSDLSKIPTSYFEQYHSAQRWAAILTCVFLLGQAVFIVNLIAGFIRGRKQSLPE